MRHALNELRKKLGVDYQLEESQKVLIEAQPKDEKVIRYFEAIKQTRNFPIDPDTFRLYFADRILESIPNYRFTEKLKPILRKISDHWNSEDPRGLCLVGRTGTGKSSIMKILNRVNAGLSRLENSRVVYDCLSAKKIALASTESLTSTFDRCTKGAILVDDFGAELGYIKSYGNEVNMLVEIIHERYDKNLATHLTSNLSSEQIFHKYGERTFTRIEEMMRIIDVNCENFRAG